MIDPGPAGLQAAALELRRQPAPGVRVLPTLGRAWEHFDIRIGERGHPALDDRLVRRALAYGIDRVAIAREAGELAGASEGALEPLDSTVFLADSPFYQPNWKTYRHRPEQARRLLEQAGCRRGGDGIYSCDGERLSLRFATTAGVVRRERTVERAQAQLRRVGVEVIPVYGPPAVVLSREFLVSGDWDLALFSWVNRCEHSGTRRYLPLRRRLQFHGLLRPPGHARPEPGRAHPRRHAAGEPSEQDRREAGGGRTRHPALSEPRAVRTQGERPRRCSEWRGRPHLERGGLVARGASACSGDRRLAPRRLGRGRLRRADAEARRNARVRPSGLGAPLSQRASRQMHRKPGGDPRHRRDDPATGVRRSSRVHVPSEARLGRRLHHEVAVHAHLPHPPRSPLERRRADHGPRFHLHPPGLGGQKRGAIGVRPGSSTRPSCQRRRREDGPRRPPLPLLGVAKPVRERPPLPRPQGRRPDEDLDRPDRQSEDGPADRERPLLARELAARSPADARTQSALLGAASGVSRPDRRPLPGREREPGRLVPEPRAGCGVRNPRPRCRASPGAGREGASRTERRIPELLVQDGPTGPSRP